VSRAPDLAPAHAAACRSVLALSDWAVPHVHQVNRLAGLLYEELRPFHGLGDAEKSPLLAAALLHDVGYQTDPARHNKVSARIIRAHLGPPWRDDEVQVIALLARYHRKAPPKLKHRRYAALDERGRRLVTWLGGILRVADGLDREHDAAVRSLRALRVDGRLEVHVAGVASPVPPLRGGGRLADPADGGTVALAAPPAASAAALEGSVRGAMRKRDLLERALGMAVIVRAV
jgi:exopolyphosphatase/guanosine-5'-triphosphate,3'-diphosphate pyrophosphatase